MPSISKKDIVVATKILIQDEQFLLNIGKFADALVVSTEVRLRNCGFIQQSSLTAYEAIKEILNDWQRLQGKNATHEGLILALRNTGFLNLAEQCTKAWFPLRASIALEIKREVFFQNSNGLEEITSLKHCYNTFIRWNIPKPDKKFTGRKSELYMLKKWLNDESSDKPLALVSAMGGHGKTELVKMFLSRYSPWLHIIWMDGEDLSALTESLRRALNAILPLPDSERQDRPLEALAMELYYNPRMKCEELLVILDNVDEVYGELKVFVDSLVARGALVILTTRVLKLFPERTKEIRLQGLKIDDAVKLVKRLINVQQEREYNIQKFCEFLECHPLAIRQAAAYIQKNLKPKHKSESCFAVYERKYKSDVLNRKATLPPSVYSKSYYHTVEMSLATVRKKFEKTYPQYTDAALAILCFAPSSGISVGTIARIFTLSQENAFGGKESRIDKMLTKFAKKFLIWLSDKVSLIKFDKESRLFTIHRLVQTVILDIVPWQGIAEKITTTFLEPAGTRIMWEDLATLTSIWLHISDHSIVKKQLNFPVKMILRGYSTAEFLQECTKKFKLFLPSDHTCFLELDICHFLSDTGSSGVYELITKCEKSVVNGNLIDKVLLIRFEEELRFRYRLFEADCISRLLLYYDTPRSSTDFYWKSRNDIFKACYHVQEGNLDRAISLYREAKKSLICCDAEERWDALSYFAYALYEKGRSIQLEDENVSVSRRGWILYGKAAKKVYEYLLNEMEDADARHLLLYFEAKEYYAKVLYLLNEDIKSLQVIGQDMKTMYEAKFSMGHRSWRRSRRLGQACKSVNINTMAN